MGAKSSDAEMRKQARKVLIAMLKAGREPDARAVLAMDVLRLPLSPDDDPAVSTGADR